MTTKKSAPLEQRYLKVGYHYYESRRKRDRPRSRAVPYVRLCGDWLQEAGFSVGQTIKVEIADKRIVIQAES